MHRLALSSWSLHASLGHPWWREEKDAAGSGLVGGPNTAVQLELAQLPGVMAARGIHTLELVTPTSLMSVRQV